MAEFWWGPTQATGRVRGAYVPACKTKCGPLLPYMLEGLEVSAPRRLVSRVGREAALRIIYEDAQLRVIEKPEGLLSVSGRESTHRDSVETRMPDARVVHRLDLDTSGVLVLAKDRQTSIALQQQFARRHVEKRYLAVVEGLVTESHGTIELALRPDVDDRPRQLHDALHGKEAITQWRVISRDAHRSRLALSPLTGRTHQLRVHCAHALGLHAPIVGDRLYGRPADRLWLHCEFLALTHPITGARLTFEAPTPF
jgi:tRNA pseudouridine32 synthase/23S rRNA pseudouridine746 synthase